MLNPMKGGNIIDAVFLNDVTAFYVGEGTTLTSKKVITFPQTSGFIMTIDQSKSCFVIDTLTGPPSPSLGSYAMSTFSDPPNVFTADTPVTYIANAITTTDIIDRFLQYITPWCVLNPAGSDLVD